MVFLVDISTDDMNFKAMKVDRKHQCVDKFLIKLVKTLQEVKVYELSQILLEN